MVLCFIIQGDFGICWNDKKREYPYVIIAIDGPAGSGKSTTAKLVAQILGFIFLDTGAMYRAIALKALQAGVQVENAGAICKLAEIAELDLAYKNQQLYVFLDGQDVTDAIRQPEVTAMVVAVAAIPGVRKTLREKQRQLGYSQDAVVEGRDMGTVVFPDADLKIYLTASIEERAQRRYLQLEEKHIETDINELRQAIQQRDQQDATRAEAPLKKAADAIELDTSNLSIEEQVTFILEEFKRIKK